MLDRIVRSVSAFTRELGRPLGEQEPVPFTRPKIGLALGGGFARGLAHVGVLKVFEEENIPLDYIAGTSVGAAIGALYCSGVSAKELEEVAAILRFSHIARWTLSRLGLCSNDRLAGLLNKMLKVKTFEELRIPLAVSTTDFATGDPVVFTSGPLVDPVRASCAYPGVFLPVNVNGRLMVDGLLAHPVPATPLKQMGAEKVIAVYFNSHWVGATGPKHFMDIIGQCFSIAQARMCELWQVNADIILEPDVSAFAYDAFQQSTGLIKAGEESARAALPTIRAWLEARETHQTASSTSPAKREQPLSIQPASVPATG